MTHISILTSTKFATSESLLVLTYGWVREALFSICQQNTKQAHPSNLSHHPNDSQRKIQQNAVRIWSWSWPLYQLAITMAGSSLLPHQWLFYFSTCQVNIWRQALALWADCCSHSCDYRHKNTKMLLCDQWFVIILLNSPGYSKFNIQMNVITTEIIRWMSKGF